MCEHKYIHLDTRYIAFGSGYSRTTRFKRIDRLFCEKCGDIKEIIKEEYKQRDMPPEWFDTKNCEQRYD